ncbi:MAG: hypothetical protein ACHBN1_05365 [Heteroscytonema crispum UTEX LB 1556]
MSGEIAAASKSDFSDYNVINENQIGSLTEESVTVPNEMTAVVEPQVLPADQTDQTESLIAENGSSSREALTTDKLAVVQLAPFPTEFDSVSQQISKSQMDLAQKLKVAKIQSLKKMNGADSSIVAKNSASLRQLQPIQPQEVPAVAQPQQSEEVPQDPLGSPHPIPWKWIVSTHQAVSANGGSGVRYYRSVPVMSPDGRYAVYSRVQLEVKPEMYNSRVTSVLFVEDTQTKKLRVVTSTTRISDPLLATKAKVSVTSPQPEENGTIGVLVPVSWSQKGDRFLARRFEAIFNTADLTDSAVIWDRQKNNTNTVSPTVGHGEDEHEKIAILLGWSKNQPDNVLFRVGEMGEENWPLVQVASDGKTVTTTDVDQPVTYSDNVSDIWAGPQVAYR